ncbi:MAG: hypothetical protein ACYCOR_10590 [Acidobacteriaceae bacterium]
MNILLVVILAVIGITVPLSAAFFLVTLGFAIGVEERLKGKGW